MALFNCSVVFVCPFSSPICVAISPGEKACDKHRLQGRGLKLQDLEVWSSELRRCIWTGLTVAAEWHNTVGYEEIIILGLVIGYSGGLF